VILIVVDSLRADHVSAYGYERPTTQNLDALIAAEGIRFDDAVSASPWTCPANGALMSGRHPSSLGASWNSLNSSLPQEAASLAEALHDAGYYTAGFVNNACVDTNRGFAQGFDFFDDSQAARKGADSNNKARAFEVNALATAWLESDWLARPAAGDQPLFLFLYYMEPHVWYNPPAPYDTLYDDTYTGTLTSEVYGVGFDVVTGKIVPSARDVEHLEALYDGEISYWDAHLGQLLGYLQSKGLLDNTLIVVTGDHGEAFGEHGKWVHGSALYEEEVRVPLVMRYPGRIAPGQVVTTPVQSMDLMPTILEYAGATIPNDLQAVSLVPLAAGDRDMPLRDIYSELDGLADEKHWGYWIAPRVNMRSIQRGEWKLIHYAGEGATDELYRLQPGFPFETENLIGREPTRVEELLQTLAAWFHLEL
jgi:arylsulfatase